MMVKTVQFSPVSVERLARYEPIDDALRVNPAGRWPWLQRRLFALLRWLGARPMMQEIISYREVSINLDDLFRAVHESRTNMLRIFHHDAKYLIVGGDVYRRLATTQDPLTGMWALDVPVDYRAPMVWDGVKQPRFFAGLKVIFVPWAEGMVLLPELE
jgi:hypothetical protein